LGYSNPRIALRRQRWVAQTYGRTEGQELAAIADVHLFIVTRPRSQKLDVVHGRNF